MTGHPISAAAKMASSVIVALALCAHLSSICPIAAAKSCLSSVTHRRGAWPPHSPRPASPAEKKLLRVVESDRRSESQWPSPNAVFIDSNICTTSAQVHHYSSKGKKTFTNLVWGAACCPFCPSLFIILTLTLRSATT